MKNEFTLSYFWKLSLCWVVYFIGMFLSEIILPMIGLSNPRLPIKMDVISKTPWFPVGSLIITFVLSFTARRLHSNWIVRWIILAELAWIFGTVGIVIEEIILTTGLVSSILNATIGIIYFMIPCMLLSAASTVLFQPTQQHNGTLKSLDVSFSKLLTALLTGSLLFSACAPAATANTLPTNTLIPATEVPATAIPTAQPPSSTGTAVTFGALTLFVPQEVASGASGSEYSRLDSEDAAWWQKTPGHLQVMLGDYYVLQGKFHQPQIYVYPAQAYAELVPTAFEGIRRVNNIIYSLDAPISADQLPTVPFFNAQQVFASNIQAISFQNGAGVRFLTQYAQYAAPVNNHELFYHFQGVTRDGAYYIIVILPVTVPVLAETSDAAATLPPGGIAYPDTTDPNVDWQGYYTAVTGLLNNTSPDAFTPTLNQLDLLIRSMQIAP